jgi:hypothetical protein
VSANEIMAEISKLSREDLCAIAVQIDRTLRERGAIVYDDAYGLFTEADQASLASEAWEILDNPHGKASPK